MLRHSVLETPTVRKVQEEATPREENQNLNHRPRNTKYFFLNHFLVSMLKDLETCG